MTVPPVPANLVAQSVRQGHGHSPSQTCELKSGETTLRHRICPVRILEPSASGGLDRLKITILTYSETKEADTYDVVVDEVADALRQNHHRVSILAIQSDIRKLVSGLQRRKPDLVFNLMEMFDSNLFSEVGIAALLDLLNLPHTGGGPGEVYLQQDKALAKRLLAFERISYPDFAVFSPDTGLETGNLRMPLFVKPLRADASIGI